MAGRKGSLGYFDDIFTYGLGSIDQKPIVFLMTAPVLADDGCPLLLQENLSKNGRTYSIYFCIGNARSLGCGLAAPTLEAFTQFFQKNIDAQADTFFIDLDEGNSRAQQVYEKAGFKRNSLWPMLKPGYQKVRTLRIGDSGHFVRRYSVPYEAVCFLKPPRLELDNNHSRLNLQQKILVLE